MQADEVQEFADALRRGLPAGQAESADRLGDDFADPPARIERGERILEDHLHPPPHRAPRRPIAGRGEVDAFDQHLARAGFQQSNRHARERRLARTGLADQPERLAPNDRKIQAVDGLQQAARLAIDQTREPGRGNVEHAPQAAHHDNGIRGAHRGTSARTGSCFSS